MGKLHYFDIKTYYFASHILYLFDYQVFDCFRQASRQQPTSGGLNSFMLPDYYYAFSLSIPFIIPFRLLFHASLQLSLIVEISSRPRHK